MKLSFYIFILISLNALLGFSDLKRQNFVEFDTLQNKLLSAALEIITSASSCGLISLDEKGWARVRMMDPFLPENDFTIWFGTNPQSEKVTQIKNDSRVTLYYTEKEGTGYVAIYGKAQIVNYTLEKEKRWKEKWKAFYPNQNEDYLLIKVIPEWLEIVSESYGILSSEPTWKAPKVFFNHTSYK